MNTLTFYTHVLSRSNDFGLLFNQQGIILALNPALASLYGIEPEQAVGRCIYSFLPLHEVKEVREMVAGLFSEVDGKECHLKCTGTGGTFPGQGDVHWQAHRICVPDGEKDIALALGRQDQATPQGIYPTRKLVHDFSKIIDALPDIAWVMGSDHTIVCANDAYCHFLGVDSQAELIGRSVADCMPESRARSVIHTATVVFEQRREIILPMLSHFQQPEVWYQAIHTPLFDDTHTKVIGLLGIYQDISLQVARENSYLETICSTNEAVFILDTQCRIIRRLGRVLRPGAAPVDSDRYRHLDLKVVFEIIHPQDLERAQGFLKRIVQTQTPHQGEFRVKRVSRGYALMEVRGVYRDDFFPEGRIYVVVRDISHSNTLRSPDKVLERLKQAAGTTTNKGLAACLHVSPTSISNAIKLQKIPADWLISIGLETGFSVDWLVTGRGEKQRSKREKG
ncbi:MAG: hypothetical protein CSA21_06490 [Deltaproteobacteria bacterium]|nr:MAG: hypothetical protein CSA21_06490 [Deltaproteobacteria bacterium]